MPNPVILYFLHFSIIFVHPSFLHIFTIFPLLLILCFYIYPIYSVWILSSLKAEIHCFVSYRIEYSGSQLLGRYPWGNLFTEVAYLIFTYYSS